VTATASSKFILIFSQQRQIDEQHPPASNCSRGSLKLDPSLKAMCLMSILFILCTLPSIIIIVVDSVSTNQTVGLIHLTYSSLALFIYCIASPMILVFYLPGLRRAVMMLCFSWKCCTTTTITSGSVRNSVNYGWSSKYAAALWNNYF